MARRRARFTRGAGTGATGGGAGGTTPPPGPTGSNVSTTEAEKLNAVFGTMRDTLRTISSIIGDDMRDALQGLDIDTQKVGKSIARDFTKELRDAVRETNKLKDKNKNKELLKDLSSVASVEKAILANKQKQERLAEQLFDFELLIKGTAAEHSQAASDIRDSYWNALEAIKMQGAEYDKLLKKAKRFETSMGGLAVIMKTIGGLPFIGPLISQLTKGEKVLESMKKKAEEGGSKMEVFAEGLMQLGANFGVGMLGLLAKGFETLVKLAIQFNQKAFDFAKNLGVSVSEAGKLHGQLMAIAHSNFLLSKEVTETYSQLTNTFGFLVPANKAFAETAALVQKRIGASADQMAALATASAISGKKLNQTYGILQASAKIEGARNKLALTQRQILDGIAKTSATVLMNFKGDIEALSAAIVRATKLGTTLEQVNKQASSLLDFESSISSEIEASVITGRESNLINARNLALTGDTAGLMEELNKQMYTYDKFMNLNVIARDAEAKRIGLTSEEYAKILLQQKQVLELGGKEGESLSKRYETLMKTEEGQKRLSKVLSQQELSDLKRASIQDKFNTTVEKFKEILGSTLQGPVIGILEKLISFVNNTEKMKNIADKIKNVFIGIADVLKNIPAIMNGIIQAAKILAMLSVATAVARVVMAAGMGGIPGLATGLIVAGGVGMYLEGLVDKAMSGMTGGGNTPTVGTPNPSMAAPVNPATAAAETSRVSRGAGAGAAVDRATASNNPGNVYLDKQKVGQILFGQTQDQIYGLGMA